MYVRVDQSGKYECIAKIHDRCCRLIDVSSRYPGHATILDGDALLLRRGLTGYRQEPAGVHDGKVAGFARIRH